MLTKIQATLVFRAAFTLFVLVLNRWRINEALTAPTLMYDWYPLSLNTSFAYLTGLYEDKNQVSAQC